MSMDNDRIVHQKLKHFQVALGSSNESHLEWAIQKLGSLNNQVAATNSEYNPLYSAFQEENFKAFCMLLSHGADYTLKNQKGLTILHLILKSITKNVYPHPHWIGRLDNPFVTAILTAHIEYKQSINPCDPNGLSHFHAACMTNNVEAVQFFLHNGASVHNGVDVNSSYFPGYTPLHFAVRHFSVEVVEILLKHGARINLKNAAGIMPIHVLLKRNFEMVNINNDIQSSSQQERALSEKIARLLLKNVDNKDTMMIDDLGLSCLHAASALMDLSAVEQLLEKVTNVNHCVNLESPLWAGYTALHFAAFFDINIVKLLVRKGADMQAKDAVGVIPLDLCLKIHRVEDIHSTLSLKTELKDIIYSDGETKLLDSIAAMISYEHFKKFLRRVTNNKVITLPNDSPLWPGFTLMHLVVFFARSPGNLYNRQKKSANKIYPEMLLALFEKNEKMIESQDIYGRTPLHLCFRLGRMENVTNLLINLHQKLHHSCDIVDEDNLSLLHIACANDNDDFVNKLLLRGSNLHRTYKGETIEGSISRGWTPLHLAVVHRKKGRFFEKKSNVVRSLLEYGANVNAKDAHGLTPVHLLVLPDDFNFILTYHEKHGNDSIDDILLSSPCLEEAVAGDSGLSHLHVACSRGREDIVRKLVDKGADVNGTIKYLPTMYEDCDSDGSDEDSIEYRNKTPLYVALNPCLNDKIVDFLLQRGADIFVEDSKGTPLFYQALNEKIVMKVLRENQDLQVRAEGDIGLTMLHEACKIGDLSLVRNLLDNGADIDARISLSSPIWQGHTPLHIALPHGPYYGEYSNDLLKLLLERKADVTLPNAKQRTPLHVAFQHYISQLYYRGVGVPTFEYLSMMLKAHKDFNVNPTSVEGITHFHIACSLADEAVVEKFLKYGHVDVDQPIDFFFENEGDFKSFPGAGCTPLHLAVMKKNGDRNEFVEFQSQLETVDLLLKHGANVNAENARGETPFHIAIRFEIRERLVRDGAYVNAKDAFGFTTLQKLLSKRPESSDTIKELLRCGCRYNAFNFDTGIGCIGLTMRSMPLKEIQKLVSMAAINFPDIMKTDECGRTMIHNLVSIYQIDASETDYATLIEQMIKTGNHIDDQDQLGRTALHVAVEFKNLRAISGLLLAGADINITDVNGQTAFARQFKSCTRCDQPTDAEDEQCEHYKVFKILAQQVKKLQTCGLDVHPINKDIVATSFSSFGSVNVSDRFASELAELKNIKIGLYCLTLHDFMSEINAVADYPTMSEAKQNAISEFFMPHKEYRQFREKYSEVAGLLRLQYRKAVERTELIQEAKRRLDLLTDIPVPEVCSRIILQFLTNSELENTIDSC